jgi:hypothetical protein
MARYLFNSEQTDSGVVPTVVLEFSALEESMLQFRLINETSGSRAENTGTIT